MANIDFKKLDFTRAIEEAIPNIIEAFIEFYGEEEREHIESKFSSMIVVGYGNSTNLEATLRNIKQDFSEKIINEFLAEIGVSDVYKDEVRKKLFDRYGLEFPNLFPLSNYIKYKNANKEVGNYEWKKKEAYEFLKKFYPNIRYEELEDLQSKDTFKEIDALIPFYEELFVKYEKEKEKISEYIKENEENERIEKELNNKYYKQLVLEFSELLPTTELEKIKKEREYGYVSSYNFPVTVSLFGTNLEGTSLLESFSTKSEEKLQNEDGWRKESVLRDRIKYFNNLGLNLGDDYNQYLNYPNISQYMPSKELVNRILNRKKELLELSINDYYKSTKEYKTHRKRIDDCKLLLKDDEFNAHAYHNKMTFISPNIKEINGEYVTYPVVCINNGGLTEYFDSGIIHELNHIYELNYLQENNGIYEFICGWDIVSVESSEQQDTVSLEANTKKREYELFSEIINELIAQSITTILHNKGIYIINDKNNARIKGATSYENSLFLVREFYETYKQEIIASRRDGDMQILFDKVGKENFDNLNALFHEFYEYFGGMKYYNYADDIRNNKDTELVRRHISLEEKRDAILESMREYSNTHKL